MKIRSVKPNNKKKIFEVRTSGKSYPFPYVKVEPMPAADDPVTRVHVDKDLGGDGFQYELSSGKKGTVHIEQVLEYNQDPNYLRDILLYKLTLEAQKRVAESRLAKREIVRRLGTSPTQLYRLLDQTNYEKSVDQLVSLLQVLDCNVDLVVRAKSA
jgi:DNA-binding TFAR19-related protein (PDSD5 family)